MSCFDLNNRSPLLRVLGWQTAPDAWRILPNIRILRDLWCQCILSFPDFRAISRVFIRDDHGFAVLVTVHLSGPTHSARMIGSARRSGVFLLTA